MPDETAVLAELDKLHQALNRAEKEFISRYERLRSALEPETLTILDAQRLILQDQTVISEVEARIRQQHENAAQAWHTVLSGLTAEQEAVPDEYLRARAADFRRYVR